MDTKLCRTCMSQKPFSDFHLRAASNDGLSPKCRDCAREYDKRRAMAPHRVKARSEYQKTEAGKAAVARARRKYVETNPIKRKAHIAVGNALRDGKLKPDNCEICGNPKAQAHHDDYSKPLDVRWLCTTHHAEWHKHNTPLCPDPGSSGMTTETSNARGGGIPFAPLSKRTHWE